MIVRRICIRDIRKRSVLRGCRWVDGGRDGDDSCECNVREMHCISVRLSRSRALMARSAAASSSIRAEQLLGAGERGCHSSWMMFTRT